MKKTTYFITLCILVLSGHLLHAQSAAPDEQFHITAIKFIPNTIGTPKLSIDLSIGLSNGVIDPNYYLSVANRPKFHLTYGGNKVACAVAGTPAVTKTTIQVVLSNLSEETVNLISAKDNKISIVFDEDIVFQYTDNSISPAQTKTGRVAMAEANKVIESDLSFPDDEKTGFITSLNNFYYYKNKVDFGVQPASETAKVSYTLNLDFQNLYSTNSLLKCPAPGAGVPKKTSTTLIYYGVLSRFSTNKNDSLNFVNIYPLIINGRDYTNGWPKEWFLKVGHESSQDFTYRRVAADASMSIIIPNLIDLTSATSTRLRLKPVIGFGLKGYEDYSRNKSAFLSGQAYINGYYYIPVYDHYAIILNNKTFYDVSKRNNPKRKLASNYSITVGTEIPKTGFKVMFKYEDGKSEFTQKETSSVVIGLIMNLFNEKSS